MNTEELKEYLLDLFIPGNDIKYSKMSLTKNQTGYELEYGRMYEAPTLNFNTLIRLSEVLGTEDINVDNYSNSGCESCDWGSDYGHKIQITNPTKQLEELEQLASINILHSTR